MERRSPDRKPDDHLTGYTSKLNRDLDDFDNKFARFFKFVMVGTIVWVAVIVAIITLTLVVLVKAV